MKYIPGPVRLEAEQPADEFVMNEINALRPRLSSAAHKLRYLYRSVYRSCPV